MTMRRLAALMIGVALAAAPAVAQQTDQTGTGQTGTDQTGTDQTGTDQTGTGQTGTDPAQTGNTTTGTSTLPEVNAPPERYVTATGGILRVLDKLTGTTADFDLKLGEAASTGRLTVTMDDCRYPADDPPSEAYAHLTVMDLSLPAGAKAGAAPANPKPLFQGWMIASSPALSALDHPRYDVWVLTCDLPKS
jgi:hypothetical protein